MSDIVHIDNKNEGPKWDPCGTPEVTATVSEHAQFIRTLNDFIKCNFQSETEK